MLVPLGTLNQVKPKPVPEVTHRRPLKKIPLLDAFSTLSFPRKEPRICLFCQSTVPALEKSNHG
jgi:hypothetical protein